MTGWYNSSWRARFLEYRKEGDGSSHPLLLCDKTHRRRTMMSGDDRQNSPSISRQNRPSATLKLLKRAKDAGFFIRCYYVLTADPQINVARVASRVSAGGHDVPTDKIISRYDKALSLVHELIPLCDVCHIYDNSLNEPYRIFKKRKEEYWYCPERYLWRKDNIVALTGISNAQRAPLNNHRTQS